MPGRMSTSALTRLDVASRAPAGSREARRRRREGVVPGVLYGGDGEPISFYVGARELRAALAARGAVLELSIDSGRPTPAVLKASQRHVVRGELMHVDLVRVRLDQAIQANVPLILVGGDDSPGVRDGGVLEHVAHTVLVEALPTTIPESVEHDVSGMAIGDTLLLSAVVAPPGVTLLGDLDETVVATLTPPRLRVEGDEEIEQETGLVGEGAPSAEADAEGGEEDGDEPSGADGE
jgi:large subunit ribosomal protein L25